MDIDTFEKHKRLMMESLGIQEGVDDPIIFKAVFTAGGPGSGKSFLVNQVGFEGMGFRILNSDQVYERLLKKAGLPMEPDVIYSPQGQQIRARAKELTAMREDDWLDGRIGIVVDGTGKDYNKIEASVRKLKELGYETMMILVNTDLKTAQDRNITRARKLPPKEVRDMWQGVQSNIGRFQSLFGQSNFIIIDNNGERADAAKAEASNLYGKMHAWATKVPNNQAAKQWIASKGGRL